VHNFALLLIATALVVIVAAALGAKAERRYRGRHVRCGVGRHGRSCRSDRMDRVLSVLARVDVWILIMSAVGTAATVTGAVFART
jgi:hypothetical protein